MVVNVLSKVAKNKTNKTPVSVNTDQGNKNLAFSCLSKVGKVSAVVASILTPIDIDSLTRGNKCLP